MKFNVEWIIVRFKIWFTAAIYLITRMIRIRGFARYELGFGVGDPKYGNGSKGLTDSKYVNPFRHSVTQKRDHSAPCSKSDC